MSHRKLMDIRLHCNSFALCVRQAFKEKETKRIQCDTGKQQPGRKGKKKKSTKILTNKTRKKEERRRNTNLQEKDG